MCLVAGPQGMATAIRVSLAKADLDGQDRSVKVVAGALRDAGMDVMASSYYSELLHHGDTLLSPASLMILSRRMHPL